MKALVLQDLRKTYANGVEALRGIDLEVEEGDFFGLLGPNGAGKTTAIGIVASLVRRSAGRVEVFGTELERDPGVKRLIGLVPQEFNFNQFERAEQIVQHQGGYYGLPPRVARRNTEKCLRRVGLWEKRKSTARELSGGMKRRLLIARALVHEPRLLILDEPTAGVDIEIRRSTWELMEEINRQGRTVILTTHYLEEAESLCRRIAIIDHGSIVEDADTRSLLAKLHIETFVLDLARPLDTPPRLDSFPCRLRDPETLEVEVSKERSINDLFSRLGEQGIEVLSLRNKANRLEELFVRLMERNDAG